jgi:hypothetical protein
VRAFTGENLNIRVFRRRRFRSGPSNQGGFGIYPLRGSVHVRTEGPSRQTSAGRRLGPDRLSDAAASPPERHAPEPGVITAMGKISTSGSSPGVVPSIELLVQLLSTSK